MSGFAPRLDLVPESPGVYLMKNTEGSVIYVGKAINLRNRLRSYFGPHPKGTRKVLAMIDQIADFQFVLCQNELEALVLESSLIKQYQPFYNVLLKDDHDYPYVRVTLQEAYPRITKAYRIGPDSKEGARYYGPYLNGDLNRALRSLHQIFPLKTCRRVFPRDIGKERPCLQYYIHRCIGPCLGSVREEDYRAVIEQVCSYFEGRYPQLLQDLRNKMQEQAARREYEQAACTRDRIQALEQLLAQNQNIVLSYHQDMDVLALCANNQEICLQKLEVRNQKISGTGTFFLEGTEEDRVQALYSFCLQHYQQGRIPSWILLDSSWEGWEEERALTNWLSELAERKVELRFPKRGTLVRLLEMASQTATEALRRRMLLGGRMEEQRVEACKLLQTICALETQPRWMEAYDISNNGTEDLTGAMTVFHGGIPQKARYRTFHIRNQEGQDDYLAMRTVLQRRLEHWDEEEFAHQPDLILVDGGLGHVHTIEALFRERNLQIPVVGMVKDDRHRTRGLALADGRIVELRQGIDGTARDGFALSREERLALLRLLTAMQDETHRRALAANQSRKKKRMMRYRLEEIPGIGPARRKALLTAFGSIRGVEQASVAELVEKAHLAEPVAEAVFAHFHSQMKGEIS